jgi:hypothetical protein
MKRPLAALALVAALVLTLVVDAHGFRGRRRAACAPPAVSACYGGSYAPAYGGTYGGGYAAPGLGQSPVNLAALPLPQAYISAPASRYETVAPAPQVRATPQSPPVPGKSPPGGMPPTTPSQMPEGAFAVPPPPVPPPPMPAPGPGP